MRPLRTRIGCSRWAAVQQYLSLWLSLTAQLASQLAFGWLGTLAAAPVQPVPQMMHRYHCLERIALAHTPSSQGQSHGGSLFQVASQLEAAVAEAQQQQAAAVAGLEERLQAGAAENVALKEQVRLLV